MAETTKDRAGEPRTTADTPEPAEPAGPKTKTVHVVLTSAGRLLGDRHHDSAAAAAQALAAAAVPGVVLSGKVLQDDDDAGGDGG